MNPDSKARRTVATARAASTSYPYTAGMPPSGLVPTHMLGTSGPFGPSRFVLTDALLRGSARPEIATDARASPPRASLRYSRGRRGHRLSVRESREAMRSARLAGRT